MTEKLLLIDDEPDIRTFLGLTLEDMGYAAETAENGEEGLRIFREKLVCLQTSRWRRRPGRFPHRPAGPALGLSISYGIVTEYNGRIMAKNNKDGGACFIMMFPAETRRKFARS